METWTLGVGMIDGFIHNHSPDAKVTLKPALWIVTKKRQKLFAQT
jgi:hypothetical protein